ncbi:hypothetical protein POM88_044155 [Heracleum sosnowskyi]|uniref:Uncharacterized protein n=1 Tax=Heracleum sosnowskyi TaxID=360622 RepID=A0AAD8H4V6_9APIA|nr:hypothetical protein POM88_044155 [Heracleum sosnowskyi]
MLKRQGTSLKCSHCGEWENNVRTCALKKAEKGNSSATKEDGMEQDEKVDMETKRKEELAKNPEILSNFLQKIKATQDDLNAHKTGVEKSTCHKTVAENGATIAQKSPPRMKQLARKNLRSTPLKNATLVKSHGGVVKPFKTPSQTAAGVEYFERNGQQFTTLKQLEAHIRKNKKQAVMDKD